MDCVCFEVTDPAAFQYNHRRRSTASNGCKLSGTASLLDRILALRPGPLRRVVRRRMLRVFPVTHVRMAERVRLLKPDRIAPADRTAADHGGVDADVDLVVLGRCTQDARIFG